METLPEAATLVQRGLVVQELPTHQDETSPRRHAPLRAGTASEPVTGMGERVERVLALQRLAGNAAVAGLFQLQRNPRGLTTQEKASATDALTIVKRDLRSAVDIPKQLNLVKVIPDSEWATTLSAAGSSADAATVTGFFTRRLIRNDTLICKESAGIETIIHELLHSVANEADVGSGLDEGMTEYWRVHLAIPGAATAPASPTTYGKLYETVRAVAPGTAGREALRTA